MRYSLLGSWTSSDETRRLCQILLLSFGGLCLLQATLNITLRLSLHSGNKLANPECNTTHIGTKIQTNTPTLTLCKPVTVIQNNGHCNELQERFNFLTREKNLLQDQVSKLKNEMRALREQRMLNERSLCPNGWKEINNRCYFLSTEKRTWNSSWQYCQSQGADLVVINDEREQRALYQMNGDSNLLFWIGLYDDTNGAFKWVDNTPLTTSFWQTWQPDHGSPNNVEACVEMHHQNPVLSSWNDAPCGQKRQWLCEKGLLTCS